MQLDPTVITHPLAVAAAAVTDEMSNHSAEIQALVGFALTWVVSQLKKWAWFKPLNLGSDKLELTITIVTGILIGSGFNYEHRVLEDTRAQFIITLPTYGMAVHSAYQVLNQRLFTFFWRVKNLERMTGIAAPEITKDKADSKP